MDDIDYAELERTTDRRLNVGCGNFPLNYWTNLDMQESMPAQIHADALEYLAACDAGEYDEIYAGHFLEHLTYDDAKRFLSECYRVLTPGGKLGIVVPDMREVMSRWLAGAIDSVEAPEGYWWAVSDLDAVCHLFLYSDVQVSPHKWAWELVTLARAMHRAGFTDLVEINRYTDPCIPCGAWYQCGARGYKPKQD